MYFGLCFGNFPTVGDLIFARYCLGIQKERWQKDSSTKMLCEGQLSLRSLFAAASVADLICWIYFAWKDVFEWVSKWKWCSASLFLKLVKLTAFIEKRGGALLQCFSYSFVLELKLAICSLWVSVFCPYICICISLCVSVLSNLNKSDQIADFQQF